MYQHLLLVYDGSAAGQRALMGAVELARWAGSEVTLVAIMSPSKSFIGFEGGFYDRHERNRQIHEATLADGVLRLARSGLDARSELLTGDPVEEISRCARKIKASLIVVGQLHHPNRVARWWRSSRYGALVENSPCNVLIVSAR